LCWAGRRNLKGKREPMWMAKGVLYLDREKAKEVIKKLLGPGGM
jgi:hypothetical protein